MKLVKRSLNNCSFDPYSQYYGLKPVSDFKLYLLTLDAILLDIGSSLTDTDSILEFINENDIGRNRNAN